MPNKITLFDCCACKHANESYTCYASICSKRHMEPCIACAKSKETKQDTVITFRCDDYEI